MLINTPVRGLAKGIKDDAQLLSSWWAFETLVNLVTPKNDEASVSQRFVHVRVKHKIVHKIVSFPPVLLAQGVVRVQVGGAPSTLHVFQLG